MQGIKSSVTNESKLSNAKNLFRRHTLHCKIHTCLIKHGLFVLIAVTLYVCMYVCTVVKELDTGGICICYRKS